MSRHPFIAVARTGYAMRFIRIDAQMRKNIIAAGASGRAVAAVDHQCSDSLVFTAHEPEGHLLARKPTAVLTALALVDGSVLAAALIESSGLTTKGGPRKARGTLQTYIGDIQRLLAPPGPRGGGGREIVVRRAGAGVESRFKLRPPRGRSVWLVFDRNWWLENVDIRGLLGVPPVDEMECMEAHEAPSDEALLLLEADELSGPPVVVEFQQVPAEQQVLTEEQAKGLPDHMRQPSGDLIVAVTITNRSARPFMLRTCLLVVRQGTLWRGRAMYDITWGLGTLERYGPRPAPLPEARDQHEAKTTRSSLEIEPGGCRAFWAGVDRDRLADHEGRSLTAAVVVEGPYAGIEHRSASRFAQLDWPLPNTGDGAQAGGLDDRSRKS